MMRKARDLAQQHPGAVVFLDFDGANFDFPQVIRPMEPNRPFWKRAMQIALDDLAGYVTPEHVVLCEGGRLDGGKDFDAECYNKIFQAEHPQTVFLGAGNADDIQNDPRGVQRLLTALAPNVLITRVIDRDDRTENEIRDLNGQNVHVCHCVPWSRNLLDDAILTALCEGFGNPASRHSCCKRRRTRSAPALGEEIHRMISRARLVISPLRPSVSSQTENSVVTPVLL